MVSRWITRVGLSLLLIALLLSMAVDGKAEESLSLNLPGENVIEPGKPLVLHLTVENHGTTEQALRIHYTLQRNPGFREAAETETAVPQVGELVASGSVDATVPANDSREVVIRDAMQPGSGAYLLGLEMMGAGKTQIRCLPLFVLPEDTVAPALATRFGFNGNAAKPEYAESMRRCGFGWVRFENGKWAMYMPSAEKAGFDGGTAPWHVNMDQIYATYRKLGLRVLPYVFQTPGWATSAPDDVKRNRMGYPPRDPADYGEAIFQKVARYGKRTVPPDLLKTEDKKSGLNLIDAVELWNEPNLNDPGWGPFVGGMAQYFAVMRAGVEGARKADPTLTVTAGGLAGLNLETVGQLGEFHYDDGKTPLDLVDVINVHFYSGRAEPETAGWDPNANRDGSQTGATYPEQLTDLVAWRDRYKPKAAIWMTETGNDVGGPIGLSERHQAGKVPRAVMLALAAGIDKVFIYRETGSTPAQHAGAGLLRNDGSIRPVWLTVATMMRQLQGFTGKALRLPSTDPNVWLLLWDQGERRVIVGWTLKEYCPLGIELGSAKVCDGFGHATKVAGTAQVELGYIPIYLTLDRTTPALQRLISEANTREQGRVATNERRSKIPAALFDFGSTDRVGMLRGYGLPRRFTAITKDMVWSEVLGYGFAGKAAGDVSMRWIADPLECDGCRLAPGGAFRFRLGAGTHTLRVRAGNINAKQPLDVTVRFFGDTLRKTVTDETPVAEFTVTGGDNPVEVSVSTWSLLRWITAIPSG